MADTKVYAERLANLLNEVRRVVPENQQEVLLGESTGQVTGTQGHALMMLLQGPQTNSTLAKELDISAAGVTKAMRGLQKLVPAVVSLTRDPDDARSKQWSLTDFGQQLAAAHAQNHQDTLKAYMAVLNDFSADEQAVIGQFIHKLSVCLDV
jgi:DNA-binding MarR family transcriptional regulator